MYRWFSRERLSLFNSITYFDVSHISQYGHGWPKVGSDIQSKILEVFFLKNNSMGDIFTKENTNNLIFYSSTAYNWLTITHNLPPIYDAHGNPTVQTKYGKIYLKSESDIWFAISVLNSNFAYWYWLVFGDGFDVTKRLLGSIPISPQLYNTKNYLSLVEIGKEIQQEMEKHIVYKKNAGKLVGNYNLRLCRKVTYKADEIILAGIGFSEAYLDDVIKFCDQTIKTNLDDNE
jgi:hypothetical protein